MGHVYVRRDTRVAPWTAQPKKRVDKIMTALTHLYPWLLALHLIAVIAFMAGMLYLPRLFVYHARTKVGSEQSETFKIMEKRLLMAIINPAYVVMVMAGLLLTITPGVVDFSQGWFWAKILAFLGMAIVHGFTMRWCGQFARDRNGHSPLFFRVCNEIPTIFMVIIVILAVVKPF